MDFCCTEPIIGVYLQQKMNEAIALTPRRVYQNEIWENLVFEKFIQLIQADPLLKHHLLTCYCSHYSNIGEKIYPLKNRTSDNKSIISPALQVSNFSVGTLSVIKTYQGKFHKWNEVWHQTKHRGVAFFWQSRWDKHFSKVWRRANIESVSPARKWASRATKVGGVLLVADIALSGELKPSHAINATMLGASTTGVGSIIAGVWFLADAGTLLFNLVVNQENRGLGDIIDDSIGHKITLY